MGEPRRRTQILIRGALLLFVVVWLFSADLRGVIPFWLPFAVLLATEAEFLFRGLREPAGARNTSADEVLERRSPGTDDADLGWLDVELGVPAPPRERLGSTTRRIAYAGGALVAAVLFFLALRSDQSASWSSLAETSRKQAETRFSREASTIAGKPVQIHCDEAYAFTGVAADAAGVAFRNQGIALLAPDICRSLYDLTFTGEAGRREDMGWAIVVLAHEATHLRGIRDEGLTECYALQEGVALGERLGLKRDEAARLMSRQLDRALSARGLSRLEYRPPDECRNGGKLDLRPRDSVFP